MFHFGEYRWTRTHAVYTTTGIKTSLHFGSRVATCTIPVSSVIGRRRPTTPTDGPPIAGMSTPFSAGAVATPSRFHGTSTLRTSVVRVDMHSIQTASVTITTISPASKGRNGRGDRALPISTEPYSPRRRRPMMYHPSASLHQGDPSGILHRVRVSVALSLYTMEDQPARRSDATIRRAGHVGSHSVNINGPGPCCTMRWQPSSP